MKLKLLSLVSGAFGLLLFSCSTPITSLPTDSSSTTTSESTITTTTTSESTITTISKPTTSEIDPTLPFGSGLAASDPIFRGELDPLASLEIYFIEMIDQYGDAIFLKLGDVDILLDAGQYKDGENVKNFVSSKCVDKRLDVLLSTHAHGDHIGGMPTALEAIDNASYIIDFGYDRNISSFNNYKVSRDKLVEKGARYVGALDCVNNTLEYATSRYFITPDFTVDIIDTGYYQATGSQVKGDLNLTSVATLFTYKDFTFFTAGDLSTKGEEELIVTSSVPKNVNLFKASHHGTNGGNIRPFLDILNPDTIAISAARYGDTGYIETATRNLNGATGHPYPEAIERFYATPKISQNKNVYWNMPNGTLKFVTTGTSSAPNMSGSVPRKGYYDDSTTPLTWNSALGRFNGLVTGEENAKLHETKIFKIRGYDKYL
ncbi:MAG: MBL fold metallo-hydrolase [Bacilli bacterium]